MWKVAIRPRWILALLLSLVVAAGFVLLSQWQISRSSQTGTVVENATEHVVPLDSNAKPQEPVNAALDGQMVSVEGNFTSDPTIILSDRLNDGETGYWVVGHFRTVDGVGLAVALGWSADLKSAQAVKLDSNSQKLTGRYMADEAPQSSDYQHGKQSALSIAGVVNIWSEVDPNGVYNGYLVTLSPADGLVKIHSPAPEKQVELNLLNVFYAVEWVIFAGFAIFLWWRLVKDAWLREQHP
ncbi:MAG: hypothetical protein KF844_06590 [Cryobacterium sp.]|nr:hypothetical protein [Cryobacterium sp.]